MFGVGQVGRALSARLTDIGLNVRVLSRNRPAEFPDGVDWRSVNASDPNAASEGGINGALLEPATRLVGAPITDALATNTSKRAT